MQAQNNFTQTDYLAYLFEDKTCETCAINTMLLCPKTIISRNGIEKPDISTCECWSRTAYRIGE